MSVSVGRFSIEVSFLLLHIEITIFNYRKINQISSAGPGNWILLDGVDAAIKKTATVTDAVNDVAIFKPLQIDGISIVKLAVEPYIPSELPKMIEALRRVTKVYHLFVHSISQRY